MKLVLFKISNNDARARAGALVEKGVVDLSPVVKTGVTDQATMVGLINSYDELKPALLDLVAEGVAHPLQDVSLLAPLPRPGKILNCLGNYREHQTLAERPVREINMFMKNPDAVVGPEGTIELPDHEEPYMFMHEAELALVMKGPAKKINAEAWQSAVFGYTCMIDVSARGRGRHTWKAAPTQSWIGKSFDTFAPLGPCITTADEINDPNDLRVRFWTDGQLRHDFTTDDMEHRVPRVVEFATSIMTLNSGDVISTGTNHEGLGPLQDGETVEIEIEKIGKMKLGVFDPLKRKWDKGIYMGNDSVHPDSEARKAAAGKYEPR